MIPKIIHYCWFGGEKPKEVEDCMKTWNILSDYTVKEWNEDNCTFNENDFVRVAAENKRWGYIGDYYRYLALYNEGGIYLDTDVVMINKFDSLLEQGGFIGYIFDSGMGTAVLGFKKGHPLLRLLLETYNNVIWKDEFHFEAVFPSGRKMLCKVSNDLLTGLLLDVYPDFKLNGLQQKVGNDLLVLPKEELELGYIRHGKGYCIHKCTGLWDKMNTKKKIYAIIKKTASLMPGINWDILIRTISYKKRNKQTPFYYRYIQDREIKHGK